MYLQTQAVINKSKKKQIAAQVIIRKKKESDITLQCIPSLCSWNKLEMQTFNLLPWATSASV